MKLIYIKNNYLIYTTYSTLRMFRKNWPELSPISEFEKQFFYRLENENRVSQNNSIASYVFAEAQTS